MYFDQLLDAAHTRKLAKILFFSRFQAFLFSFSFFSDFTPEINKKRLKTEKGKKLTRKLENGWKKCFNQLSGARSTRKLVEIHNSLIFHVWFKRQNSRCILHAINISLKNVLAKNLLFGGGVGWGVNPFYARPLLWYLPLNKWIIFSIFCWLISKARIWY